MCVSMSIYVYLCASMCIYVYLCAFMCMYMSMCMYMYIRLPFSQFAAVFKFKILNSICPSCLFSIFLLWIEYVWISSLRVLLCSPFDNDMKINGLCMYIYITTYTQSIYIYMWIKNDRNTYMFVCVPEQIWKTQVIKFTIFVV